jgi:outer membrane protein TolC
LGEKLVQLAWKNHPTNEILRRQVNIARYETNRTTADWLDVLMVQGNINEFNIDKPETTQNVPQFWPRYNFGLRLPLGIFVNTSIDSKQNRQRLVIAESEINAQKLEVRRIVLKAYNDYLWREKVLKLQSEQFSDIESNFKLVERRYANGEITFDQYSVSQTNLNRASIQFLEADRDFKNAKLDLEQLIGVRLEDVL